MAEFPAMPFWFDAYYRDTQHLTYEEHGIYLHLISLLWHAPAQRIPKDRKWLERRFKEYTPKALALIAEFCLCDRKWITQSKVMREFQYAAETSERQRKKVKSRWNKEKGIYRGNTDGSAVVIPSHTHTHTQESKKDKTLNGGAGNGEARVESKRKPRHGQKSKNGRVWLDKNTADFEAYAHDYYQRHHQAITLLWGESGAWFNLAGEYANQAASGNRP